MRRRLRADQAVVGGGGPFAGGDAKTGAPYHPTALAVETGPREGRPGKRYTDITSAIGGSETQQALRNEFAWCRSRTLRREAPARRNGGKCARARDGVSVG